MYGIDSTAVVDDITHPWALPHTASVEAYNRSQSDSLKYLVYIRKGTYQDYWVTMPGVDIYFEENAVVWYNTDNTSSRSIISDWRGGAGDYTVLGKGRFYVSTVSGFDDRNAINFKYNSTLKIECKELDSFQFWNQFKSEVSFDNVSFITGEVWAANNIGGMTVNFNSCVFKLGYTGNVRRGSNMIFNDCTFNLPDVSEVDAIRTTHDHNGNILYITKTSENLNPYYLHEYKFNTSNYTPQDVANIKKVYYYDTTKIVSPFEVYKPQIPYQGYQQYQYDFVYTLVNPTFYVNRPNCIAVRVVWEEDNPDIDYSAEGIKLRRRQGHSRSQITNPFLSRPISGTAPLPMSLILYKYNSKWIYRASVPDRILSDEHFS